VSIVCSNTVHVGIECLSAAGRTEVACMFLSFALFRPSKPSFLTWLFGDDLTNFNYFPNIPNKVHSWAF
jgi:hypothetical protein